jgi:hypothetical protein
VGYIVLINKADLLAANVSPRIGFFILVSFPLPLAYKCKIYLPIRSKRESRGNLSKITADLPIGSQVILAKYMLPRI